MKTFKEYLIESDGGNYVCIDVVEDLSNYFVKSGLNDPTSGTAPPKGDYHCTLMYSKNSSKDCNKVMQSIKKHFKDTYTVEIDGFDCFDSLPENGSRDSAKSCIVMRLKSQDLVDIHKHLQSIGLDHSYSEYAPHVTLRYNMSVEEAHFYKDKLNASLAGDNKLSLAGYKSQPINTNYV